MNGQLSKDDELLIDAAEEFIGNYLKAQEAVCDFPADLRPKIFALLKMGCFRAYYESASHMRRTYDCLPRT